MDTAQFAVQKAHLGKGILMEIPPVLMGINTNQGTRLVPHYSKKRRMSLSATHIPKRHMGLTETLVIVLTAMCVSVKDGMPMTLGIRRALRRRTHDHD
jgi:hypothetical protein